jgi:hypothetical protein
MYMPMLGRFLSRDPLIAGASDILHDNNVAGRRLDAMRSSANRYAANNPTNLIDPSGLSEGNPGVVCIDKSCSQTFTIVSEKDSVWDRCSPGDCCDADGVFMIKKIKAAMWELRYCNHARTFSAAAEGGF